jgi:hypothetical protein
MTLIVRFISPPSPNLAAAKLLLLFAKVTQKHF